jgi:Beta-lactamase superfamily domain
MRIDFIGHASLLIRSGELALLTDPWWAGPAYQHQWFPYPFPVPERHDLGRLDAIYISHGHEDHLHAPTLAGLGKDSTVVLPRSFDAGNVAFLHRLGFKRVEEIAGGQSLRLARGPSRMRLTVHTYLGDSILAVEADNEVLLNLNDALHCARDSVIDEYCRLLAIRFPRIDYLFCGFGGASYFPNCFRRAGKDDVAVARRREELFLRKLSRIVERLLPAKTFPFAAHFVLPDERNWWISKLRLQMPPPARALRQLCRAPSELYDLAPGDFIEHGRVSVSPPAASIDPESVRRAVLARYPLPHRPPVDAQRFAELVGKLERMALRNVTRVRAAPLDALIRLWDYAPEAVRVRVNRGRAQITRVSASASSSAQVVLETRADLLETAIDQEYGRDQLCIGYGALIHLQSAEAARTNLHERLLSLITPFPTWLDRLRQHPVRCLTYLFRDPGARLAARNQLTRLTSRHSPLYAADDWL